MLDKAVILFLIFLTPCGIAGAGDLSINGFIQGNYSANIARSNPDGEDYKWAEERIQLKLSVDNDPSYLFIKGDVFYDHIDDKSDIELREGYLDYLSGNWDLRIGRQIITWGVGDLIFINDVFPKDYVAFFLGRPMEYLKKGVDGVKISIYPSFASAEFVIIPFFESDVYPLYPHSGDIYPPRVNKGRFWVFDPRPAVKEPRRLIEPPNTLENTELALRIYRNISDFDVSIYYYRGFYKRPFFLPDKIPGPTKIDYQYPELSVYGVSMQGQALNGVLSLEGGFYDSRQDRAGTEPQLPNQTTRFLIGYQNQVWEDFTFGLQYYAIYTYDYREKRINIKQRAPGCPLEEYLQDVITLRLTHMFLHQTLRLSFFAFLGLADDDYLLIPEIKYNLTDHLWASLGANIFSGKKPSQIGSLKDNDNLYVQARYEF